MGFPLPDGPWHRTRFHWPQTCGRFGPGSKMSSYHDKSPFKATFFWCLVTLTHLMKPARVERTYSKWQRLVIHARQSFWKGFPLVKTMKKLQHGEPSRVKPMPRLLKNWKNHRTTNARENLGNHSANRAHDVVSQNLLTSYPVPSRGPTPCSKTLVSQKIPWSVWFYSP